MIYNSSNFKKDIILFFIMGALYMVLEGLWRGWTNISMLVVGGLCSFLIGRLNERQGFCNCKMWQQCAIGTAIVLAIEFTSGVILNVWLKLNIWDYSNTWGNLYGQICIPYAVIWFFLVPLGVYGDDYLRYKIFGQKKPVGLLKNYKDLFTCE
ncbi:putative ABC transporter permease [Clostridium pasteurianum]|uniref:Putative membrane protein n=1 Tax=Clostridium pasteurianum BC1 TaxID=86416 RepID=R4K5L2_CLOPA|nr:hypothetical protein [Clostridium pasteurianum]AGK95824.1 putative membrane protein [Clostridium pasteurianum BC1]